MRLKSAMMSVDGKLQRPSSCRCGQHADSIVTPRPEKMRDADCRLSADLALHPDLTAGSGRRQDSPLQNLPMNARSIYAG